MEEDMHTPGIETETPTQSEAAQVTTGPVYPGSPLSRGSRGSEVMLMQSYLNAIREGLYPSLNKLVEDGIFGSGTEATVIQYQVIKGLAPDGIIGRLTWNAVVTDYGNLPDQTTDLYPGSPLRAGSVGAAVATMQEKLNQINPVYTSIGLQKEDGVFGPAMSAAVRLFQKQFGLKADEVIGEMTWYGIVGVHGNVRAGQPDSVSTAYPGQPLSAGSSGDSVRFIQSYMNTVGLQNGGFPYVAVDGRFGSDTRRLVTAFQAKYGLAVDGAVGPNTWQRMMTEFNSAITL